MNTLIFYRHIFIKDGERTHLDFSYTINEPEKKSGFDKIKFASAEAMHRQKLFELHEVTLDESEAKYQRLLNVLLDLEGIDFEEWIDYLVNNRVEWLFNIVEVHEAYMKAIEDEINYINRKIVGGKVLNRMKRLFKIDD